MKICQLKSWKQIVNYIKDNKAKIKWTKDESLQIHIEEKNELSIKTRYEWIYKEAVTMHYYEANTSVGHSIIVYRAYNSEVWRTLSKWFGETRFEDYKNDSVNNLVTELEERYFNNLLINDIMDRRGF